MIRLGSFIVSCGFLIAITSALPQSRIANGKPVDIQNYPYQVSINAFNHYRCSGVIISADWVLTTTHCVSFSHEDLRIHAGSAKSTSGSVHKIAKVIEHDHYTSQLVRFNDISLIKVDPPFELDETTKSIPLVDADVSVTEGYQGVISGWGTGDETLKAVAVDVMSLADCVETYQSRFGNFAPGVVCTKSDNGAPCSEIWSADDSGAPLVVDGKLAGVFSWGYRCDLPQFPAVFSEVAYFRDWIRKNSGV